MPIDVQILTVQNAHLLDNVAPEVFDNPIHPESLKQFLEDPRHIMFIATDGDLVVGMASGVEYFHPDKEPQLWINEVGVAATYRDRGIGRRLVAVLVAFGKQRNCTYAWLGTDTDNVPAQRCFSAHAGVEKPQPFLLYEWDLEEFEE